MMPPRRNIGGADFTMSSHVTFGADDGPRRCLHPPRTADSALDKVGHFEHSALVIEPFDEAALPIGALDLGT